MGGGRVGLHGVKPHSRHSALRWLRRSQAAALARRRWGGGLDDDDVHRGGRGLGKGVCAHVESIERPARKHEASAQGQRRQGPCLLVLLAVRIGGLAVPWLRAACRQGRPCLP